MKKMIMFCHNKVLIVVKIATGWYPSSSRTILASFTIIRFPEDEQKIGWELRMIKGIAAANFILRNRSTYS